MNKQTFRRPVLSCLLIISSIFSLLALASQPGIEAFKNNQIKAAKEIFKQSLKNNDKNTIALQYLAKIALNQGELDDAEEYIEDAQELAPSNASIHFDAARIMGAQAQDSSIFSAPGYASDALKAFKKAAQLEPETIQYRQGLMSFYLQAPGFLGGDNKLAMAEAKAIAKLDEVQGFIALANVYQSTDEDEKLKSHYASADIKYASNANIIYNRGLYYQSQQDFTKAVTDFQHVQRLKPIDQDDQSIFAALYQIGRSSVLSESQFEVGIVALQNYIEKAPVNDILPSKPWAKYRLGYLHKKNGDKNTARKLYKEAKSETQDKTLAKKLKKALKRLR